MKKVILSLLALAMVFTIPVALFAQEDADTNLIAPYEQQEDEEMISPDSPFYFLVTLLEEVDLLLTFDEEAKMEKSIKFAERKLRVMERLDQNLDPEVLQRIENRFEKLIQNAERFAQRNQEREQEMEQRFEQIQERHMSTLREVYERVPQGQAKESIQKVMDNAETRYQIRQEKVKRGKPSDEGSIDDDETSSGNSPVEVDSSRNKGRN